MFRLGPKYGHIHPAIYLTITAIGSAYLIAASQGFGIAIVYSIEHWSTDNELLKWEFYVLAVFVVFVCVFQIDYLNRALKYFSASIVTPLNFVFMSTTTLVTTSVLYQGFQVGSAVTAVTILIGFLVIVLGVVLLLQYNLKLTKRDTMKERSIEDRLFRELDYDIQNDNPFSMLNKAYSIQSSRIEPFGESQIELPIVIDQDKRHLRKRSNASSVSNTPSDPAFGHDKPQPDDDGGSI